MHRRCASFKKVPFVGRQKRLFCWRTDRDSNPRTGLTVTRFPVVRLRPTRPSVHSYSFCRGIPQQRHYSTDVPACQLFFENFGDFLFFARGLYNGRRERSIIECGKDLFLIFFRCIDRSNQNAADCPALTIKVFHEFFFRYFGFDKQFDPVFRFKAFFQCNL